MIKIMIEQSNAESTLRLYSIQQFGAANIKQNVSETQEMKHVLFFLSLEAGHDVIS